MAKSKAVRTAPVKTVTVTAMKYHTLHGAEHQPGKTYSVPEGDVASLVVNGYAAPSAAKTKAKTSKRVVRAGKHRK